MRNVSRSYAFQYPDFAPVSVGRRASATIEKEHKNIMPVRAFVPRSTNNKKVEQSLRDGFLIRLFRWSRSVVGDFSDQIPAERSGRENSVSHINKCTTKQSRYLYKISISISHRGTILRHQWKYQIVNLKNHLRKTWKIQKLKRKTYTTLTFSFA